MSKKHQELGYKNISNLLVKLSLPSMVAMFANAIYNIVDTIFDYNFYDVVNGTVN